jgi:cell division protein FtsL
MMALLATAPALPLHSAGKYVAGAYIVFVLMILIYVAIMAMRLVHTQRELAELKKDVEESERSDERDLEHVG